MATIRTFEELDIWQSARAICKRVYMISKDGEFAKDFRFRDQIRASSGSCMDNIAEGFERDGNKEFVQFLSIAKASIGETRSQLTRAYDVNYINENDFKQLKQQCISLSKSIAGFINYLKNSEVKGNKFKEDESVYEINSKSE